MSNRCGELKAPRTYEIDDRSAGEKRLLYTNDEEA
jgi:hypothetical protein